MALSTTLCRCVSMSLSPSLSTVSSVLSSTSSARDGGGGGGYGVMGTYEYVVVTSTMVIGVLTRFVNLLGKSLRNLRLRCHVRHTSGMTHAWSSPQVSARPSPHGERSPKIICLATRNTERTARSTTLCHGFLASRSLFGPGPCGGGMFCQGEHALSGARHAWRTHPRSSCPLALSWCRVCQLRAMLTS